MDLKKITKFYQCVTQITNEIDSVAANTGKMLFDDVEEVVVSVLAKGGFTSAEISELTGVCPRTISGVKRRIRARQSDGEGKELLF